MTDPSDATPELQHYSDPQRSAVPGSGVVERTGSPSAGKRGRVAGRQFDVLVIGSSPILLIEAPYQRQQGRSVAVIEKRSQMGGAWYSRSLWNRGGVEVGCHYIDRTKRCYGFLAELLNLDLQPQDRQVMWQPYTDRLESSVRAVVQQMGSYVMGGRLLSRNLWDIAQSFKGGRVHLLPRRLYHLVARRPHLYPSNGCSAIVAALDRNVRASGIEILYGHCVDGVELAEEGGWTTCVVGSQRCQTRMLITGQNEIFHISVNGQRLGLQRQVKPFVHVVLRIRGRKSRPFTYIDVAGNRLLKRVVDVTGYSTPDDPTLPSDLILCCQISDNPSQLDRCPTAIFDYLKTLNLLNKEAELLDSVVEKYPATTSRLDSEINRLDASLPGSIRIMKTWDLALGIDLYHDRWKSLLH